MKYCLFAALWIASLLHVQAQETQKQWTLDEVLRRSLTESTEGKNALLEYRNSLLEDQIVRKEYLPTLAFNLSPINFNHAIRTLQNPFDGSYSYIDDYANSTSGGLTLSQKIPYLNGMLMVSTSLNLLTEFSAHRNSFSSSPYRIGYQQQLAGGYKSYKLEQQLHRLKRSTLVKNYVFQLSKIQQEALRLYMQCYTAQLSWQYSTYQQLVTDSLLNVVRLKYEQGKVLEKEITGLELQNTIFKLQVKDDYQAFRQRMEELALFLHTEPDRQEIESPEQTVPFLFEKEEVRRNAHTYNPQMGRIEMQRLQNEMDFHAAKMAQSFNANINLYYGSNQYSTTLKEAYRHPLAQQGVNIGVQIPLFNWGIGRHKVTVARNNYEINENNYAKELDEWEHALNRQVEVYNLAVEALALAKEGMQLATKNYELALFAFANQSETAESLMNIERLMKEQMNNYLTRLATVWNSYFEIRSLSLYDYIHQQPLIDMLETVWNFRKGPVAM